MIVLNGLDALMYIFDDLKLYSIYIYFLTPRDYCPYEAKLNGLKERGKKKDNQ